MSRFVAVVKRILAKPGRTWATAKNRADGDIHGGSFQKFRIFRNLRGFSFCGESFFNVQQVFLIKNDFIWVKLVFYESLNKSRFSNKLT